VVDYCGNSKRISDYHPGEVASARTSIRIKVPRHLRCSRRLRYIQHGPACAKLFSCATAMEERIWFASVYGLSERSLGSHK